MNSNGELLTQHNYYTDDLYWIVYNFETKKFTYMIANIDDLTSNMYIVKLENYCK